MPLKSLSLTHYEYETGDAIGHLAALLSCAPIFLVVAYATLLASRRDLATASLFLGQLLNEALNAALKARFRQPRPAAAPTGDGSSGMPSAHAQFSFFLASYAALWALRAWRVGLRWRLLAAAAGAAGAALVAASRVYLHYHTLEQVLAGGAVGAGAGAAWFAVVQGALRPRFAAIAAHPLARWLWVRDCSEVNVLECEYLAVAGSGRRGKKA